MKSRLCAIALFAGVNLLLGCGEDSSATISNETAQTGTPAAADTATTPVDVDDPQQVLQPCDVDGQFIWEVAGKSYFECENGFFARKEVLPHTPGFNPCQFNMGAAWQAAHEEEETYDGLDYIAVWLGDNDWYNEFEKRMVEMCVKVHATPMIYAYVIAEFGKDNGLVDCDMIDEEHPNSLCTHGANIIREFFFDSILTRYATYASGMREQLSVFLDQNPDTYETIWLIEPDFYQYSETGSRQRSLADSGKAQIGGGIPDAEMGLYFAQIVWTIKQYLPAAKIAIDISPWISDWPETSQSAWYSNFDMSLVDYASTSGGGTAANNAKIRAGNKATWQEIYAVTGKPILADAGYDKGGQGTGHSKIWDMVANLNARIADNVVGVMQMDASLDYPAVADTIRPQLKVNYPWCVQ